MLPIRMLGLVAMTIIMIIIFRYINANLVANSFPNQLGYLISNKANSPKK